MPNSVIICFCIILSHMMKIGPLDLTQFILCHAAREGRGEGEIAHPSEAINTLSLATLICTLVVLMYRNVRYVVNRLF